MAYDAKCFDLAEKFLSDEPAFCSEKNKRWLAQAMQTNIEQKLEYLRSRCDCCGEPMGRDIHKNCVYF